jgi:TusA-related sulfurtransferase
MLCLATGQVAEVLTTEADTVRDIVVWSATHPVELLAATSDHGTYRVVVRHA